MILRPSYASQLLDAIDSIFTNARTVRYIGKTYKKVYNILNYVADYCSLEVEDLN